MTIWSDQNLRRVASVICLLGLALVVLYLCYLIAKPFLGPVTIAVMLSVVFHPLHTRIASLIHRTNLASVVSTLLVFFIAIVPVLVLGIAVSGELRTVVQSLRESAPEAGLDPYLRHWREVLQQRVGNYMNLSDFDLHATLLRWAEQASRYVLSIGTSVVGNLVSLALDTVVVFFTLFFFFREGNRIRRTLSELLPFRTDQTDRLFTTVSDTIIASLYGSIAVGLAQGTLTGVSFWVLGLSAPTLWALVTALASMVPLLGSALVWAPASFVLMVTGHWVKALVLLVWGAVIVGQVDVLVRPWVVSARVKVHSLLVFFALLGGAKAFGVIGIFVGPIILSFALGVFDLLRRTDFSLHSISEEPQLVSVNDDN